MPLLPAKWIGVGCLCNRSSQQEEVVHHPTEHHGEPADHADGGKGVLLCQFSVGCCPLAQLMILIQSCLYSSGTFLSISIYFQ